MTSTKFVVCAQCGWVHFPVTAKHVAEWYSDWARMCKVKPIAWLKVYGIKNRKPPSCESYYKCFNCGNNYQNFRDAELDDARIANGHTIQPILGREYAPDAPVLVEVSRKKRG
jgi:hypothetical protein